MLFEQENILFGQHNILFVDIICCPRKISSLFGRLNILFRQHLSRLNNILLRQVNILFGRLNSLFRQLI